MSLKIIVGRKYLCTNEFLLQYRHKVEQIFRTAVSYVVYAVGRERQSVIAVLFLRRTLHNAFDSFDDIVHIREIALAVAEVEYLYGLALQELVGKAEVCHIGSACRSVDREETQSRGRDIV